mgnify:CR=1 FL=1
MDARLIEDAYTELFPKVYFSSESYEGSLIVTPSFRGLDSFDLSAVFTSKGRNIESFPFPVCQVYSRNISQRIFSDSWMKTLSSRDQTFDHWFVSKALEYFPLGDFLGERGKRLFFSMHYLYGRNNLYMSCQGAKVLIRKTLDDSLLCEPHKLRELWRLSRVFFRTLDRSLRVRFGREHVEWIHYVGPGDEVPCCRICGELIYFNRIFCARCETPHHLDCWQYNNGCSVYACGCRDYKYPRLD